MITRDIKKILFALLVSALLIGGACAASVNSFDVNKDYKNLYQSEYYSVYANGNQDSGMMVFQNVNDDRYDDMVNDDILDGLIHHDGREYLICDNDMKVDVGSDNIVKFTDYDHATHGVSEVVKADGKEYIVAIWAKDSSNIKNNDLMSKLNEFNKNNKVEAVAF
ncbi:hypothetical protein [uncultured Methanobrevibacter sp.]|uniref:hypothetical protein n=1 Tax=uncultured Methanobrevibacter sp. TaxID=253161 RepID=UPI0025D04CEE|nr:hypothetical protein [uncultured Methanobrevibacter sp.]